MAAKTNKNGAVKKRGETLPGVAPTVGIAVVLESDDSPDLQEVFDMVTVLEVTPNGSLLQAELLFEEEEIITLQLSFGAGAAHRLEARVVAVSATRPAKMRVKFLDLTTDAAQALVEYCESIR